MLTLVGSNYQGNRYLSSLELNQEGIDHLKLMIRPDLLPISYQLDPLKVEACSDERDMPVGLKVAIFWSPSFSRSIYASLKIHHQSK